jgi:thioredoxin-related protein/outer membrane protein assembly factor BamD (BamD/ComL family)
MTMCRFSKSINLLTFAILKKEKRLIGALDSAHSSLIPHPSSLITHSSLLWCSLLVLIVWTEGAQAQEVRWRYDYNSARREAQEKNLPLVVDFGTENCYWCNKLDASTFHDPTVVASMNEHFVPLRVDAQRNPALTEALRIQAFPTVVLAASDGKILGTLEGYIDANRFHDHLQRVLISVSNPEWMTRDYQEAAKAVAGADYARAIALLKGVTQDGQSRPIQLKSRQLLNDLEQQAADRLVRAKQAEDKGHLSDAMETLTELVRVYPGTQAATEGGGMLSKLTARPEIQAQQRTRRARDLLGQAKEEYRTQQYLLCLDRCDILAANYADLPEATEATQLAADIKSNPEWMRQVCNDQGERLGGLYLCLAETYIKKGQAKDALLCFERVIQSFPGSRQAEVAQQRLAQLQGQPTRQADFKKR